MENYKEEVQKVESVLEAYVGSVKQDIITRGVGMSGTTKTAIYKECIEAEKDNIQIRVDAANNELRKIIERVIKEYDLSSEPAERVSSVELAATIDIIDRMGAKLTAKDLRSLLEPIHDGRDRSIIEKIMETKVNVISYDDPQELMLALTKDESELEADNQRIINLLREALDINMLTVETNVTDYGEIDIHIKESYTYLSLEAYFNDLQEIRDEIEARQ